MPAFDNLPTHRNPRDREKAARWAQNLLARQDWLIIDFETTGTGPNDEIIQIGILHPDGTIALDSLVKPVKKRMNPDAVAVHGITMKMLKDAPTLEELLPQLEVLMARPLLVSYNAEFEARLLMQSVHKLNLKQLPDIKIRIECAMLQYAQFYGEWNQYRHEYKWQKLPGAQHGAIADCKAVLELLQGMAATVPPLPPPPPPPTPEEVAASNRIMNSIVLVIAILVLCAFCTSTFTMRETTPPDQQLESKTTIQPSTIKAPQKPAAQPKKPKSKTNHKRKAS